MGAGTMGGGIAWLMASAGMFPLMKDLNKKALSLGLQRAHSYFFSSVKRKKLALDGLARKMHSIAPQKDYLGFQKVDLVIEAIVENKDIKKKVFAEVEKYVSEKTIITSNTSSISIEDMSKALSKPERFVGLHFFNPVNRMPLVEIITHPHVDPKVVMALYHWVLRVKKTPVVVKDGPGFLVNRILMPYLNEALFLLEEGVPLQSIEEAALHFGMPMGPLSLLDEVGIDVASKVATILHEGLGERAKPSLLSSQMVKEGLLGKKSGSGFYLYGEKKRKDQKIEVNQKARDFWNRSLKKMDEVEIQQRLFYPMINEASLILEEKLVDGPLDVDLGLIFGIGFPPFRGGALKYADNEGPSKILEGLKYLSQEVHPQRFHPSSYLEKLVEQKKKF